MHVNTPFMKMLELYDDKEEFVDLILFCMKHGYVRSDSERFMCRIPCFRDKILGNDAKELDTPDTWAVFMFAGDMGFVLDDDDETCKYAAWQRFDSSWKVIELEKLRRICYGKRKK